MQLITLDAAAIGIAVTMAMQFIKALPKKWITTIFGKTDEIKRFRMQLLVFGMVFCATIIRMYQLNMFKIEKWVDILGYLGIALASSYTAYQGIVKNLSLKLPENTLKM